MNYSVYEIKKQLKERFCSNKKRYIHTLGVVYTAKKLAKINGASNQKIIIASLLHDVTKLCSYKENIDIIRLYGYNDSIINYNEFTIHALSGMLVAKHEFNIEDNDILEAIRCHTVGKANMNLLSKILSSHVVIYVLNLKILLLLHLIHNTTLRIVIYFINSFNFILLGLLRISLVFCGKNISKYIIH